MNHPGDLLSAYLDGELGSAEHTAVAAHLGTCGACRGELTAISEARSSLRSLPTLDAPNSLLPAGTERSPRPRGVRPVWAWAAAAAVALALGIGLAVGPGSSPSPMDLGHLAERHTARVVVQPGVQTVRAVLEAP